MNEIELHDFDQQDFDQQDFDQQVDAMKAHTWHRIVMWPQLWSEFKTPANHVWDWHSVPFQRNCADAIPSDQHGVYTFAIAPNVAQHPLLYLVTYVGKAYRMTLYERFLSYFNEKKSLKRPHIRNFLRKYEGFVMFSFCPIADVSEISEIEDELISALIPRLCRQYPSKVSAMVGAFDF